MTKPLASFTFWRRLIVDALTAVAGFALALAAIYGTADVLQQVLLAALSVAAAAMMEPQSTLLRRSDRRAREPLRRSPVSAR